MEYSTEGSGRGAGRPLGTPDTDGHADTGLGGISDATNAFGTRLPVRIQWQCTFRPGTIDVVSQRCVAGLIKSSPLIGVTAVSMQHKGARHASFSH